MVRNRSTKKAKPAMSLVHPNAAAIDIGATMHMAAVSADRTPEPVRSFGTFTADLHPLVDWFTECGVETVVMESTGVYWIPIFELLDTRGWTDGFAEGSVGPRPVRELDYLFGGVGPVGSDRHSAERTFQMSPLRMRMIEDMKLAGLSPGTQATYVDAVRKLAAYYRRSPDQLSEEEVRAYILHLRERGAARGTFKANYYGIQYLYRYTVSRDWALFAKKRSVCRDRSGCPARLPTPRSAGCLAA